ncbi:hypothetical protein [Streptomyces sp. NBC_00582]|uniref:hypothetical protein n=1 Tax=Streptomyces sp. NBC_00582 TaxID=2975783 RepID=UPI002E802F79|nr:hypothetical protein [Streptomyces sp. NBC_00582]WUB64454.1 hypothetical protein OG852_30700 [Streptomyces sp. NBC_00582]
MAHTFEELVETQQAADQAHAQVLALRDEYGRVTVEWTDEQNAAYETAWRNWRALAEASQAAVTGHAKDEGAPRYDIEAKVRRAVRHPEPVSA